MKTSESMRQFLDYVKVVRANKTWKSYRVWVEKFVESFGNKDVEKLKRKTVKKWFENLRTNDGKEYANDSKRAVITTLTQWQKYALEEKHIRKQVVKDLEKPPGVRRERVPTSEEQEAVLREATPAFADVYTCLLITGARPHELADATIEDYDEVREIIELERHKTVRKTGKRRQIGVGEVVKEIIKRQIGDRTEGPIFLNDSGRKWSSGTLSHSFCTIKRKLGLCDDLVLYSARHYAGTEICRKLGIHAAAHALGHADLKTTQRYVHLMAEELATYQDKVFGNIPLKGKM